MQPQPTDASIYDCLVDNYPAAEAIMHSTIDNLDIICSRIDLVGAEVELMSRRDTGAHSPESCLSRSKTITISF